MYAILLKVVIFLIIETMLFPTFNASLDVNLIAGFFSTKFLRFGYLFGCLSNKERINFTKSLTEHQLRISQNKIEQYSLVLSHTLTEFPHHYGVIVDGDCSNVNNLIKEAEDSKSFDDKHHWLVTTSSDNFLETYHNLTLNINVDLYVALRNKVNGEEIQNWTIIDVYNPASKHGGVLKAKSIGFYNQEQGFRDKLEGNKYWVRKNMTGVAFKTMVVIRKPFQGPLLEYLESDANRRTDSFNRFQYRVVHYCKELYNFSWEVNMTNSWGYAVSKDKFDGMIGALQRKEIDFGSAAVFIKDDRIPIIDFARGLWMFRSIFIFRHPSMRSFAQVFLHPMSTSVWVSTLIAGVLVIIVLRFIQVAEFKILKNIANSVDRTWSSVVLFVLGTFCQQGCPLTSYLLSARVITVYVLLFCLLFYQFYSGSIVSNLLTKPPAKIKNLQDLLDSDLKVGSDDVPYIRDYFRTSTDPTVLELYQRKFLGNRNTSNYYPPEDGMKLVGGGGFAYQVEISAAYPIIKDTFSEEAICELGEVKMLPITLIMAPTQKHSPFRDMLNYCFYRQIEHGINERQKKHWGPLKPQCMQSRHSMKFNVAFKEIYPALILLGLGMLMSLIVLGIEMLVKMWIKRRNMNAIVDTLYQFLD